MKLTPFTSCSLIVASLISCEKPKSTQAGYVPSTLEVIHSLDGFAFTVELPKDFNSQSMAGLAFKKSDGSVDLLPSSNGFKAGDTIKYICYNPSNGVFKYSFTIDDGMSGSGSSVNLPKQVSGQAMSNNQIYKPNEKIARYSEDSSITITGSTPVEDDFDLIFYIQKPNS